MSYSVEDKTSADAARPAEIGGPGLGAGSATKAHSHTTSEAMTQREERIRGLALNGRKTLSDAYGDPHFCVGSSWATLNLILGELGEAYETPPWNKQAPQADEEKSP